MDGRAFRVRDADWAKDGPALSEVRTQVFVVEQGVDVELERDGHDPDCWHAIAEDEADRRPVGAGRLSPDGKVGRVAVLGEWRGIGVGGALMRQLLARADAEGMEETHLHSQAAAAGFYHRLGFVVDGDPFIEAEIPHVRMVRRG